MLSKNKIFNIILWISHFITDSIASFVLTILSLKIFIWKSTNFDDLIFYFFLYNFFAFFSQIFVWYLLDLEKDNLKNFFYSKIILIFSFLFYLIWIIFLNLDSLIFSILLIWIGSSLFHVWAWNISLLSEKNKATNLWIFACFWVLWLSFWAFLALYFKEFYYFYFIVLAILSVIIYSFNSYKIDKKVIPSKINISSKYLKIYFIILLFSILAIRSAIWTNYQFVFSNDKIIIFYLAIAASLWKIIWWFLEDLELFKEKYFTIIGLLAFISFLLYNLFSHLILLLIWIFLIALFISPVTFILYSFFKKKRATIIWYSFWFSLILGFLIYYIR